MIDTSHFIRNPAEISMSRSQFKMDHNHKTTFNAGKLIPLDWYEVYPGDTFKLGTSAVIRMTTPIAPVMDDCYFDLYYFFVPNRLIWNHWKQFMKDNPEAVWYPTSEKTVPQINFNPQVVGANSFVKADSILSYLGIPSSINFDGLSVNQLPVRAYVYIWSEFFRDQNTQYQPFWYNNDNNVNFDSSLTYTGGALLPVNKYHDYFTTCAPAPQKGPSVKIPGFAENTFAPVNTYAERHIGTGIAPHFVHATSGGDIANRNLQTNSGGYLGYNTSSAPGITAQVNIDNMYADLGAVTSATISQLRQAFAVQRTYERMMYGSRYVEMIKNFFGITSPDARQQRPECIGGKRYRINMNQVVQTSATSDVSPQGHTGAYSLTGFSGDHAVYSATEHGIIMTLGCVRTAHTYQQGIEKKWSRKRFFDYYLPTFAHISEQPVLNQEIYAQALSSKNEEVFGYQEAWADLKYIPNRTSGYLRSTENSSLDFWHYGDNFSALPVLNDSFMKETEKNIDRTLAVPSSATAHQFVADFDFHCIATRVMPVNSTPGLIDHF